MKVKTNNLIIIGSTLPYDFQADYIKKTAEILSRDNKVIVFLWRDALSIKEMVKKKLASGKKFPFWEKRGKIFLFYPLHFLPFRRFEKIRNLNLFINVFLLKIFINIKRWKRLRKIAWIFSYELFNLPVLLGKDFFSLYDCVEYSSSLDKRINDEIQNKVRKLINNCQLMSVDSPTLKKRFKKYHPTVVPQGFDLETFKNRGLKKYKIVFSKNKPWVGYIGNISYRLDYLLLLSLIKKRSDLNFIFVGEIQEHPREDRSLHTLKWVHKLKSFENVIIIENQPKKTLPALISQFDICIIPYNTKIAFNYYSRAMKTYEYFYMRKPVISTPILESLRLRPLVEVAKDNEGFSRKIDKILKNDWDNTKKNKAKKMATVNSWEKKIDKMMEIISKTKEGGYL